MRYNQWHKSTNFLTPTLYTQELSEYTESLTYDLLPSDVAERAKMIILHILGAAIAAKDTDVVKKSIKMACQANGGQGGDVTVWGSGIKLSAVNAALVWALWPMPCVGKTVPGQDILGHLLCPVHGLPLKNAIKAARSLSPL